MPISPETSLRAIDELFVNRETRQRQRIFSEEGAFLNEDGLLESVKARGILSPLLCLRSGEIIFGERRLIAAREAGLSEVPVRYIEDATPLELKQIELEENIRRESLHWMDEAKAISDLHGLLEKNAGESGWTQAATGEVLNLSRVKVSAALRIAKDISSEKIAQAKSFYEAYRLLLKGDERRADRREEEIERAISFAARQQDQELEPEVEADEPQISSPAAGGEVQGIEMAPEPSGDLEPTSGEQERAEEPIPQSNQPVSPKSADLPSPPTEPYSPTSFPSILNIDFLEWAFNYSGHKFNLIHCNFTQESLSYTLKGISDNLDKLITPAAHIIVWCEPDYEKHLVIRSQLGAYLSSFELWPRPLVWHITDSGDAFNGYATAIVGVREDRGLIRTDISNCYGAPMDKKWKGQLSEPMLKNFMSMFIDDHSRVLDPACGNAASLRAAEALGAEFVLGIEADREMAMEANEAMRQFRLLRKAR